MVPVLSITTTFTAWANSKLCASLIKIWFDAAIPTPTIMAVGVAKPSAHGQAITNTVTAFNKP